MEYNTDFLSGIVENALLNITFPTEAPRLFEPVKYTLEGGGKRLRPCLTLAAFAAAGGTVLEKTLPQAVAIEMFHNFTLLHDDVMDRAELRRGRPTVHRRWNDNVAILSGDAMLTLATQILADCPKNLLPTVLDLFNTTAMEVYEGQQLDMEFEKRFDVSVDEYLRMIRLKTSVLLACACAMGAVMAEANKDVVDGLYRYGLYLGLAFQLRDDWLDTYGDPAMFGKEIGGDIINRKKTWLLITAIAEKPKEIKEILAADLNEVEIVEQVRAVYDSLDLANRCSHIIAKYSQMAIDSLANINMPADAREFFTALASKAATRNH